MVKCTRCVYVCLLVCFSITVKCVSAKEPCESSCIFSDKCKFFGNLKKDDQESWKDRFKCDEPPKGSVSMFGLTFDTGKELVCCPETVWEVESSPQSGQRTDERYQTGNSNTEDPVTVEKKNNFQYQPNYNNNNNNNNFNNYPNNRAGNQYGDQYGGQYGNQGGRSNNNGLPVDDETTVYENTRIWQNRNSQVPTVTQNPYFMPANQNAGNNYNMPNLGGQCPVTSFPPDPDTGCCGVEATDDDIIDDPAYPQGNPTFASQNSWVPHAANQNDWPSWMPFSESSETRSKRDTDNVDVTIDNRIAGGRNTELKQFPWTVLLKTTFTYPGKDVAFSCGGSLISSRYVLTAGHCVYDPNGSVKGVEINLAEYDKRTFPKDCKNVLGQGQRCIENIVMEAEKVILHPRYDDNRLHNDIALIRLRGVAPYTEYIRPVCLPPIDVDSPDLSSLRLAVAGWGRNGRYKSNIKQSTVVNLVPNAQCGESYPGISKKQLCAAGYSGEDTCKGDSGGPLMMLYGGKYYVSGVVSGKRADAPCGTSVPSLYTNVYQYLRWIRSVIQN